MELEPITHHPERERDSSKQSAMASGVSRLIRA
jgi:hypothetical protein